MKSRRQAARFVGVILTISTVSGICSNFNAVVWAQQATARVKTDGERSTPSAGSILDSTRPNGRIGGTRFDGAMKPSPSSATSRFDGGALYGSAGNVVGVDRSSANSAFQDSDSRRFQTKKNFELIRLRNEYYRLQAAASAGRPAPPADANAPRVVAGTAPRPFPKAGGRTTRYGKTPEEIAAESRRVVDAQKAETLAADFVAPPQSGPADSTASQTIWMRGFAPRGNGAPVPDYSRFNDFNSAVLGASVWNGGVGDDFSVGSRWIDLGDDGSDFGAVRSEFSGATASSNVPAATPLPGFAPTPEQTAAAFREYLEARLLRSPDVNALSPIRVDFADGVATVRGVVPTPAARETAGRILLADPRVQRVDNRLTFVRNDVDSVGLGPVLPVAPSDNSAASTSGVSSANGKETAPVPAPLPDLAPLN